MIAKTMDYINTHTGTIGFGGLGLGWLTGSVNSDLQAAVLICTLIVTAPKAIDTVKEKAGKYWPKLKYFISRFVA